MAKPIQFPPPGFEDLTIEQKIDYVRNLWKHVSAEDHHAADADSVPLAPWHKEILDERSAEYERDPEAGIAWEELRERLRRKIEGGGK